MDRGCARMRENLVSEIQVTQDGARDAHARTPTRAKRRSRSCAPSSRRSTRNRRRSPAAASSPSEDGTRLRAFEGEGNRQYLTGLRMGGQHVVILVDTSTSMLDRTIVNMISPPQHDARAAAPGAEMEAGREHRRLAHDADRSPARKSRSSRSAIRRRRCCRAPTVNGPRSTSGGELDAAVNTLARDVSERADELARGLTPPRLARAEARQHLPARGRLADDGRGHADAPRCQRRASASTTSIAPRRQLPVGVPVNMILFRDGRRSVGRARVLGARVCRPAARCSRRRRTGHEAPSRARSVHDVVPRRDLLRVRRDHPAVHRDAHERARAARAEPARSCKGSSRSTSRSSTTFSARRIRCGATRRRPTSDLRTDQLKVRGPAARARADSCGSARERERHRRSRTRSRAGSRRRSRASPRRCADCSRTTSRRSTSTRSAAFRSTASTSSS